MIKTANKFKGLKESGIDFEDLEIFAHFEDIAFTKKGSKEFLVVDIRDGKIVVVVVRDFLSSGRNDLSKFVKNRKMFDTLGS